MSMPPPVSVVCIIAVNLNEQLTSLKLLLAVMATDEASKVRASCHFEHLAAHYVFF